MTVLELKNISKAFGGVKAVHQLSIQLRKGEVFTLLGPSGCGKTTTLRLVAGLEEPDDGEIIYQNQVIVCPAKRVFVPTHQRHMGMVFQSYAIWPNMTVFENVFYPLRLRGQSKKQAREKIMQVLALVGLQGFEERPAPLLSGGQQQRVALARALVYEPALLLLDEPFSNLDAKLREQMRFEVKLLQRKLNITVLFVTHDQVEALSLSDRIAVFDNGKIEQIGTPLDLYQRPETTFVRDFLGKNLLLQGKIIGKDYDDVFHIKVGGMTKPILCQTTLTEQIEVDQKICLAIRPEDVLIEPERDCVSEQNMIKGLVETLCFVGDRWEVGLELETGNKIISYVPARQILQEGEVVGIKFPSDLLRIWPQSQNPS